MDLRLPIVATIAVLASSAAGCATVISGTRSDVTIVTNPANAHVVIQDRKGREVASTETPTVVKLKRASAVVLPARYTATVEAPGYQPQKVDIGYCMNPWAFGNIVLGGLIGLVVDDASGAMWKPTHETYAVNLKPQMYSQAPPQALRQPPAQVALDPVMQAAYFPSGPIGRNSPPRSDGGTASASDAGL
jgi:hypothetical protein